MLARSEDQQVLQALDCVNDAHIAVHKLLLERALTSYSVQHRQRVEQQACHTGTCSLRLLALTPGRLVPL